MPRITLSIEDVLRSQMRELSSKDIIEFLIRYSYSVSEYAIISEKSLREWGIKKWTNNTIALDWCKKELGRSKGAEFEEWVIGQATEVKSRDVNWVIFGANGEEIVSRKPVEGGVNASFTLPYSPNIEGQPFVIEHNAITYLITK